MPHCVLRYCKNYSNKKSDGVTFHKFPRPGLEKRKEWIKFVQKNRSEDSWLPSEYTSICSEHFREEDCYRTKNGRRFLKKCAVPYENTEDSSTDKCSTRDYQSDSSLISDPEETSGAPEPSAPDVGLRSPTLVFSCTACSKNITSFWYRCLVCPDYDMCGECEKRGGHHDDHYVLRVPMQRPTVEVDQVASAVKRALASSTTWNKVFKSTAELKDGKEKRLTVNEPDKLWNSGDSRDDTGNDSNDTEDEQTDKPEINLHESGATEPEVESSDDEPVVKVELVIKEEVDPLEEEAAASAFLQNIHERQTSLRAKDVPATQLNTSLSKCAPPDHNAQASQSVPSSRIVPLTQGAPQSQSVPTSQGVPPSKRRRGDEHRFTTTTHSHKTTPTTNETTELCTDTSSSSTVTTSSESGSKVDVFVLKKRTRPADENDDLF